jgi:two-component system OmpR family response regulator
VEILIVEDDERLARNIERALLIAGHRAELATDGAVAVEQALANTYDLILLDVLLPSVDGFSVCRELRQRRVRTPIMMLTARDAVSDRVHGLDAGADDYLTKPFATEELLARVRALGRRATDEGEGPLRVADLVLDAARHEVRRGDTLVELTPKEFELLKYLMRHVGTVVTRDQIFHNVWRDAAGVSSKSVELYVHYLRNKIDRETARPLVRTVRGVGYMVDG